MQRHRVLEFLRYLLFIWTFSTLLSEEDDMVKSGLDELRGSFGYDTICVAPLWRCADGLGQM